MEYEELFIQILDNDEKIIDTFKPKHKRFVGLTILRNLIASLLVLIFPAVFVVASIALNNGIDETTQCEINGVAATGEDCKAGLGVFIIIPCIIAGLVVLGFLFSVIARIVVYKKTCYCCTNKRIIIRRGFIGADYQTLDYDLIGGMDVRVDFFDKIMKPNTGTISFASAASPMIDKQGPSYYFAHIENPYETYKKIKEYSSTYRDGKLNS